MTVIDKEVDQIITRMAQSLEKNTDPDPQVYAFFLQEPAHAFYLIDFINSLEEEQGQENLPLYSAAVLALDLCVAQLQTASDSYNKTATKALTKLMNYMAEVINRLEHTISFWLPVLNAFYEAQVDLNEELQEAYFNLADEENDLSEDIDEVSHLEAIKDLIHDLSDLSVFEITENFFAQSYAMPPEFFSDLVMDLYRIEEGEEIALLTLLHPKQEVREVVIATINHLIHDITLSSTSLTRLQCIMNWYPIEAQSLFKNWIKIQRKKGVYFEKIKPASKFIIRATEVDGNGSQGIFIQIHNNRKSRLCGLLFKHEIGIKDVWLTPVISSKNISEYYKEAFDDSVTLRLVTSSYFQLFCEHFLNLTIKNGNVPGISFLQMQELSGLEFRPCEIQPGRLIEEIGIQISPFTSEALEASLKRSKTWPHHKRFTESWYEESIQIDKLVNRYCSIINGVKACNFEEAEKAVFKEAMETQRNKWLFHFLWITLWLQANARKNEKIWQDSFFIAYAIHQGYPLDSIPIMQEICCQSVINSVETMQERRSHLSQE